MTLTSTFKGDDLEAYTVLNGNAPSYRAIKYVKSEGSTDFGYFKSTVENAFEGTFDRMMYEFEEAKKCVGNLNQVRMEVEYSCKK